MDDVSWNELSSAEQRVIAVLGAGISTVLCDDVALRSLRRAGLIRGSHLTAQGEKLRKAVILSLAKPITQSAYEFSFRASGERGFAQ